MTTAAKSLHWPADTHRPGTSHRIDVCVLAVLGAVAAAITTNVVCS